MSRLLLVEDDHIDTQFLGRLLTGPNGENKVEVVETLRAAIDRLEEGQLDAVVLDLTLPDCQGLDGLKQIRLRFHHLPVIVLTGAADDELELKAMDYGAQDCVSKALVSGEWLGRAVRLSIARNNQILRYKSAARTDALTGLANRRALEDYLPRLQAQFERHEMPYTVLMIDIDHFKEVNDQYGHRFGDYALMQISQILLSNLRLMDLTTRYGGEEFAVLLPQTSVHDGVRVVERILREVSRQTFCFEGVCTHIHVSLGMAQSEEGLTAERVMEHADQALYAAKRGGGNRGCYDVARIWRTIQVDSDSEAWVDS